MANVKKVLEAEVNGLKVKLFEYDIESEESINQIKDYLIKKVKISKVHNISEYDLTWIIHDTIKPLKIRFNDFF